jgi:hypothetical protein
MVVAVEMRQEATALTSTSVTFLQFSCPLCVNRASLGAMRKQPANETVADKEPPNARGRAVPLALERRQAFD